MMSASNHEKSSPANFADEVIIEPSSPVDQCFLENYGTLNQPVLPRPQMYVGHYAAHQAYKNSRILCSNCGELGHTHKACMEPITSFGIICFDISHGLIKFLLVQRKHSISYIDFIRGKYSFDNIPFLNILFRTMTLTEKENLLYLPFDKIWDGLWINDNRAYRHDFKQSKKKYELIKDGFVKENQFINIDVLIKKNADFNGSLEWGFAKGRRDKNESDIRCARREFQEETNRKRDEYIFCEDLPRFTEEFIGTNGIAYRYVLYPCRNITDKRLYIDPYNRNQISEIGNIGWFTYEEAAKLIGKRNRRRVGVIRKIYEILCDKYSEELKK